LGRPYFTRIFAGNTAKLMTILEQPLPDLYVLKPTIFGDNRGYFFESFNQETFENLTGFAPNFVQDNQSLSIKGVFRGIHMQTGNYAQDKLVRVTQGSVLDYAVDLRPKSKTFGQWYKCELSADNHLQMFIPRGFGHAFIALENNTLFQYKCTALYNKDSEVTIAYNDTDLQLTLPNMPLQFSEKDQQGISLKEYSKLYV